MGGGGWKGGGGAVITAPTQTTLWWGAQSHWRSPSPCPRPPSQMWLPGSHPHEEGLIIVAGAWPPVLRMYMTARPGIAMFQWPQTTSKQTAWGGNVRYDVVMNGMHNHRHEGAPRSLYKRVTNAQSRIQGDKKDSGPQKSKKKKTAVQRPRSAWTSPCLRMGEGGGGQDPQEPRECVERDEEGLLLTEVRICHGPSAMRSEMGYTSAPSARFCVGEMVHTESSTRATGPPRH